MPCYDSGPSREQIEQERLLQRGYVVGLCEACRILERLGQLSGPLAAWFSAHQLADKARDDTLTINSEYRTAKEKAVAEGYQGPSAMHPIQEKYQATHANRQKAEIDEQAATRALNVLRPE